MLVAALAVTLVGFVLLVVALITSSVALAWACIVVCLIGFGLLIADVLGVSRGRKASAGSQVASEGSAEEEPVQAGTVSGSGAQEPAGELSAEPADDPTAEPVSEPVGDETAPASVMRESEQDR